MKNFTPGPWTLKESGRIFSKEGWYLADTSMSKGVGIPYVSYKDEEAANGILMHAAPDMYYALIKSYHALMLTDQFETIKCIKDALKKANPNYFL